MNTKTLTFIILCAILFNFGCTNQKRTTFSGELKKWHKITLNFEGPETGERNEDNPFLNYRLDVKFSNGTTSYLIPGYYAADGQAEISSVSDGNVWSVNFCPPDTGVWNYDVSFVRGENIAVSNSPGQSAGYMDGLSGTFKVLPSDKTGNDFRAKGRLQYIGEHYPQFAETGEYFLKMGTDAPENMLAYDNIDETPNVGDLRKSWEPHMKHYNTDADDYLWGLERNQGKALLGAMNYLSEKGCNAVSFLTFNFDGDDRNVFPHLLKTNIETYTEYANKKKKNKEAWENYAEQTRFDVSKMAQWEQIFMYAQQKGLFLHFKTQETENDKKMDGGDVGLTRKLYYRELIARFGHHLAMNWNLGEENVQTTAQHIAMSKYFEAHDPYRNMVVLHTYPERHEEIYRPLLGKQSELMGLSIQTMHRDFRLVYPSVKKWTEASDSIGKKWVVAVDEPGDAGYALLPDSDDPDHDEARINGLWGTWMANGYGTEWYFGYRAAHSDLTCEDYASRDLFWDQGAYGVEFLTTYELPLWNMTIQNDIASGEQWVLAGKNGQNQHTILVYVRKDTEVTINVPRGEMECGWFNPKTGEGMDQLIDNFAFTGGQKEIFKKPDDGDMILLIQQTQTLHPVNMEIAAESFTQRDLPGYAPAYYHKAKNALAINAVNYKGVFAAAAYRYNGIDGKYKVLLNTLAETDGESSYNVYVNRTFVGTYTNPETTIDYAPQEVLLDKSITIRNGDVITVEFNSHSNGKIPENDGFAFSRGRWTSIQLIPEI